MREVLVLFACVVVGILFGLAINEAPAVASATCAARAEATPVPDKSIWERCVDGTYWSKSTCDSMSIVRIAEAVVKLAEKK